MPLFFIPGNHTPQRAEEIYEYIVGFVKELIGCEIEPARIYSLTYTRDGQRFTVTVDGQEPRTGQVVMAILRSNDYLICTPSHGVRRGEPLQIGLSEVDEIEYFEGTLDHVREKFRVAVATLDEGSGSIQSRVHSAAVTLATVFLDDSPPTIVSDLLSLNHKLAWRGNLDDTIAQMSDAEAEDAAAAIRALYVDVLRPAPEPEAYR